MSDDTPEDLKKYRLENGDKLAEADLLGRQMAASCMKEIGPVLNCLKGKHEPDVELENLPQTKGKVGALMTVANCSEPSLRVRIRICRHCGCLYAEKS